MKKYKFLFLFIVLLVLTSCIFAACNSSKDLEVVLNTNGGTEDGTTVVISKDNISLPNVQKSGYNFEGWYLDEELTTPINNKDSFDRLLKLSSGGKAYVFASLVPISFNINYVLNAINDTENNAANPDTYTIEIEDNIELLPPSRNNYGNIEYSFEGWYNNELFFGDPIDEIVAGSVGDITLYAKWLPYDIVYYLEIGGQPYFDTYDGATQKELYQPTRAGYTFGGWYDNPNLNGNAISFIPEGSTRNRVFYAKWSLKPYTISYQLNGGLHSGSYPTSYNTTQNIQLQSASKDGYNFAGWYNQENHLLVTQISQGTIGDIELYAKWTPINYNITYVLYDGDNSQNNNPSIYTIEDEVIFEDPQKPGYIFDCWRDGSNNLVLKINQGSMGNIVIYAQWLLESYNINYEIDEGVDNQNDTNVYNVENSIALKPATKDGFIFKGWYDNAVFDGEAITNLPLLDKIGDITLYPRFLDEYIITYEENGASLNPNTIFSFTKEDSVEIVDAEKNGYTFEGWYFEEDFSGTKVAEIEENTNNDVTLYAKWAVNQYSITYELNGGDDPENPDQYTIEDDDIQLTPSSKIGYEFGGWYNNVDLLGLPIATIQKGSFGDLTLYADWQEIEYSIVYQNIEGATNNNASSYTIKDEITFNNPNKNGYQFKGWYEENDFITRVYGISLGSTGTIVIYAKFVQVYTIQYRPLDIINDPNNPTTYTEEDSFTLRPALKMGFTFKGWYNNDSYSGLPIEEIQPNTISGNKTFYAKFLLSYDIGYELYGGENSINNPTSYTVEDAFILEQPTKSGYNFIAWYDSDDQESRNEIEEIKLGSAQHIVLYADWEIIEYTIDYYNVDEGTNNPNNLTEYTVEDTITLYDPSKDGYQFKGWYYNEQFNGNPINSIPKGSIGNREIFAKFLKIHSITYDLDSGQNHVDNRIVYTSDMVITLHNAQKDGYDFVRWEFDNQPISIIQDMNEDIHLVAIYEIINYTIKYMDGEDEIGTATYTIEDTILLTEAPKQHYSFIDWYDNELLDGEPIEIIEAGTIGNKVFYALYETYAYEISYVLNGGINHDDNPDTYTIEESISLLAARKAGAVFAGWYDDEEFAEGSQVTSLPVPSKIGDTTLYAKWNLTVYNIVYILLGGENSPLNVATYTCEDTVQLHAATRTDYDFDGWYDYDTRGIASEDLEENNIFPVQSFEEGSVGNRVLYARWQADSYTITYWLDGGIPNNNNPETYTRDSQITLYAPSKENYTFIGWYEDAEFTSDKVTSLPLLERLGNIELFARFSETYTIIYNLSVGETNHLDNPQTYTELSPSITLSDPIKDGDFQFVGWYDNNQFNGIPITEIPSGSTGEKTFFAKFLKNYYITYNLNYGSNHPDNREIFTIEDEFEFGDPSRTGYMFVNWETSTGQPITGISLNTNNDVVVYAIFLPIFNVTYNLDGGIDPGNPTSFTAQSAEEELLDATKSGYVFEGWYSFSGDEIETIGQIISSETRIVYAHWSIIEYSITYFVNGGTNNNNNPEAYNVESEHILLLNAGRNFYIFDGWYSNQSFEGQSISVISSGSTGDRTFYAKWTPITYTISYELYGGVNAQQNPVEYTILSPYITFFEPTKDGATFVGWYDNSNYSGSSLSGISPGESYYGNRTFYAKWSLINYSITYEVYGGTNSQTNPSNYNVDSEIILNPAIKGQYTFLGWYDNPSFNGEKIAVISGSTGNLTLYALFSLTYFINYDYATDNPVSYTELTPTILLSSPNREHYEFGGWFTNSGYTGSAVTEIVKGTTGTINLYAKWTPKVYNITYELNGGYNNTNPISYNIESLIIVLTDPQKDGYEFEGWFDNATFEGLNITNIPTGSRLDKTFYAKWELINYQIEYDLNGGENATLNPAIYNVESNDIALLDATKEYYYFEGWYDDELCTGLSISVIPSGSIGDRTYYAKWSPVVYDVNYHIDLDVINPVDNPNTYTYEDTFTLEEPSRQFYIFNGWYTNRYLTGNPITTITQRAGHLDLYAKWTAVSYRLTYILDGGKNHLDNPDNYTVQTNITLQKATKAGYNFMGWFESYNGENFSQPIERIQNITGDRVLYAKFLLAYDIVYYLDGGTNNANNPENYTIEDNIIFEAPTKENHMFMGWYDNSDCTGDAVTEIELGTTNAINLYAKFMYSYRITYHLNGGENHEDNPSRYREDMEITLQQPVRSNYNFLGWYENPDFDGEPIKVIYGENKINVTLYARWGEWSYYFYYGEYPQTLLTDNNVITNLNNGIASEQILEDGQGYYQYDTNRYALVIPNKNINGFIAGINYYFTVEPIKWRLIKNDSGEARVLSELILDSALYNDVYEEVVWQDSSLRTWLNGSSKDQFMDMAFFDNTAHIISSETAISINPIYFDANGDTISSDNAVFDDVSLLSIEDATNFDYGFNESLLNADQARRAKNSDYALAKGAYTDNDGYGMWWLYTPGSTMEYSSYVGVDGKVYANGNNVTMAGYGVRPVIYLQLYAIEEVEI